MFDKSQMLQALSQLLFGMLGAVIIQLFVSHHSQKMVTVDITGLVKSFETEVQKQKLPSNELSQKVSKFSEALSTTINLYSSDNNYVLVPKEVVIAGGIDRTSDVSEIIKKRLNS